MKDKTTPQPALQALRTATGALYRHGPNGDREYLSLATKLETGMWAGVDDRGVFPGKVYGEFCGTEVVIDLYLHVVIAEGKVLELPVKWAMRTPLAPVALLGVPGDESDALQFAPSAEMAWPEYQHVHRPVIAGAERYASQTKRADTAFTYPVGGEQGSIFEPPMLQSYRSGADSAHKKQAICASADMGYPCDVHLGGPVVDDFGRLVGVIIGADVGPERGHVGMYVPADYLMPTIAMAHAAIAAMKRGDRYSTGIETVQFRNSEVDWPYEEDSKRRPFHRRDEMVKTILPRGSWDRIIDQAKAGYGTDASPEAFSEVETLEAMVGD